MNAVLSNQRYSVDEYLALEEKAENRNEYFAGEIYPMAGGTLNHNQIIVNLCILLGMAFKNRAYRVFASDVKLHIPDTESFTYPDVLVINGQPAYWQNRRDILCSAAMIIEVLSDSTKDYDRAGKFEHYRRLPELHDYLLISQDKVHVEHFVKQAAHSWLLTDYEQLNDTLSFSQLDVTLSLHEIYDKVDIVL
jgi:Uma2 family endonuclease